MKEIKTKPLSDLKVRNIAKAAPKELSQFIMGSSKTKFIKERNNGAAENSKNAAEQGAIEKIEETLEADATYIGNAAFRGGKTIAQCEYEKKQAEHLQKDGQPVSAYSDNIETSPLEVQRSYAKQRFQENNTKKAQRSRSEIKVKSELDAQTIRNADNALPAPTTKKSTFFDAKVTAQRAKAKAPIRAGKTGIRVSRENTKPISAVTSGGKAAAKKNVERKFVQQQAQQSAKIAKSAIKGLNRLKQVIAEAGKALVKMAVGLLGGASGVIALLLIIGGAVAIIATPFGIFWSGQTEGETTMSQAIGLINSEYTAEINNLQSGSYDSVQIHRVPSGGSDIAITNWTDIVLIFAVKTAGADVDATDVVTIDDAKIDLLRTVFWDMNAISTRVETIDHDGDEETVAGGWTEYILHITITSKTYTEMAEVYNFSVSQRQALAELASPEYAQMLAELIGNFGTELILTEAQIRAMLDTLPEDLSKERRAIIETAYTLLGKVNYFWGGKSTAIGWDSRWGMPTKVTSGGSTTTGTIRPYGLDCSGYVDWVFYNVLGATLSQGGGAHYQHNNSSNITWSEALTKKLSDAMGLKPDSSAQEVDALFRWTANWTNTFDGRKEDLLVLVNQATRFVVTIYGVKRAQLKQVEQRIATAISNTLHAMNLNPQIIDAYLDCGRNIQFVANRDRKAASHVSKQGLDAAFVLGRAVNESGGAIKYDDTMGHIVSNRPVNYSGGFESVIYPDKEMIHQLSAYFKMPAFRYDALELQVILDLEIYQAVRRIIVPANIELCQLHQVIQKVFGWKDYHSYDFAVLDCKNEKPPLLLVPDDTYLELDKDAALVQGRKLSEFISKDNFLVYTYDLGDNWEHKIELVREILDHDQQSPYLLEAKGKTPPEDVGGVGGFLEFRKIMIQPRHPEYEHMKQWAGYWDPELSDWESRPRVLTYE